MLCVRCAGAFCLRVCVLASSVCVCACWRLPSVCMPADAFLQRQLRAAWQIVAAGTVGAGRAPWSLHVHRVRQASEAIPEAIPETIPQVHRVEERVRSTRQKQEARVRGHPRGHPPGLAHFIHFSRRHFKPQAHFGHFRRRHTGSGIPRQCQSATCTGVLPPARVVLCTQHDALDTISEANRVTAACRRRGGRRGRGGSESRMSTDWHRLWHAPQWKAPADPASFSYVFGA